MEKPLLNWDIVGEVGNIAQLTRLDIPTIAGFIIKAAASPRILKRRVLKFGQYVKDIEDLLNALDLKVMMENRGTRNILHRLGEGFEKSLILVNKCEKHGYFYLFLKGLSLSQDLKQAQAEIDQCLRVIPLIVVAELLQEQKKNAREEEECKKKLAAIDIFKFKQHLDEAAGDITNKTDYEYFAKKWGHDERFKNLDHIQRISLFNERKGKTRQKTRIASSKAVSCNSQVNPSNVHLIVGELLDDGTPEDFIKDVIMSVGDSLPVEQLIEECEKRNRLRLLEPVLEDLVSEGSQDVHVHDALSKVIIDTKRNPEQFLSENPYYNSYVIGKYCEKRDPALAVIAYRRAKCDGKLIDVTNKNKLFELQARYVVERKNLQLWKKVLALENPFRRKLIYQVVSSALPESKNSYQISATVTAFINVDQPQELIEFLEKIVLRNSKFNGNPNLQCLLIRTAIEADRARLMTYINSFENFNGSEIGRIAVRKRLYEEAFHIFKKFNLNVQAVDVLLDHIRSFERAVQFASCVKENAVWSRLANAQLKQGLLNDAIESFISADDATQFDNVIRVAEESSLDCNLVKYLLMVKKKVKETRVLTTLNAKLASAFVKLRQFKNAFQAAQNVNCLKTWKELCFACVDAEEFKLAKRCGLKIFVKKGGLEEVSGYYQKCDRFYELISLMEEGLRLEHSPKSLQTELRILYAKYCPDKLK